MPIIDKNSLAGGRIPNSYKVIPGARGDACAIRRPSQGIHSIGMTVINEHSILRRDIPYVYCCIIFSRSDKVAVRRPCHGPDPISMTVVDLSPVMRTTIVYLPYLYRFVIAGRGDATAIGRPRQGIDPVRMASIGEVMVHCNSRGPNIFTWQTCSHLFAPPTAVKLPPGDQARAHAQAYHLEGLL